MRLNGAGIQFIFSYEILIEHLLISICIGENTGARVRSKQHYNIALNANVRLSMIMFKSDLMYF